MNAEITSIAQDLEAAESTLLQEIQLIGACERRDFQRYNDALDRKYSSILRLTDLIQSMDDIVYLQTNHPKAHTIACDTRDRLFFGLMQQNSR